MTSWQASITPPLVLIAEPGYIFQINHHPPATWDHLNLGSSENVGHIIDSRPRGAHGYLSDVADMHTTFLGYGPAFASGCGLKGDGKEDPVYIYDLFPLLNGALPERFPTEVAQSTMGKNGWQASWKVKLIIGFLFMAFTVVLILGIALRRSMSIKRKNADALLVDEFSDEDEDEKAQIV